MASSSVIHPTVVLFRRPKRIKNKKRSARKAPVPDSQESAFTAANHGHPI